MGRAVADAPHPGEQLAGARRTRRRRRWFNQELFEAGEFRTPRALRFKQDILRESPRRFPAAPVYILPSTTSAALREGGFPETARKGSVIPFTVPKIGAYSNPASVLASHPLPGRQFSQRKSPSPEGPFGVRRLEPPRHSSPSVHGSRKSQTADYAETYTHPLRGSGTRGRILEGQ